MLYPFGAARSRPRAAPDADEDIGRGAPGSRGGLRFLAFVRELGFTGLQLGPDGQPPPDDPSPYRGAGFPRNVLSIPLAALVADPEWGGVLPEAALEDAVGARICGGLRRGRHAWGWAARAAG